MTSACHWQRGAAAPYVTAMSTVFSSAALFLLTYIAPMVAERNDRQRADMQNSVTWSWSSMLFVSLMFEDVAVTVANTVLFVTRAFWRRL